MAPNHKFTLFDGIHGTNPDESYCVEEPDTCEQQAMGCKGNVILTIELFEGRT